MRVLQLGCGNMGGALLERWIEDEAFSFDIVDPVASIDHSNARMHVNADTLDDGRFDLIVIAVKPQMIADVVEPYRDFLAKDGAIVSIAAGFSVAKMRSVLGPIPVIRLMPNMPVRIGAGVSGMYASPDVSDHSQRAVMALMSRTGEVIDVDDEDDLDKVTAIAGSGPGYIFEIARTYVEAAQALGFKPATARRLVLATMSGAVQMAQSSDQSLDALRNSVTSKAGTTEAGLNVLNGDQGLSQRMKAVADAAYERAVELR